MAFGDFSGVYQRAKEMPAKFDAYYGQFDNEKKFSDVTDWLKRYNANIGPSKGFASAPGFDGSGQIKALGKIDGKILYSGQLSNKAFTGNADRPSYVFQDWANPDWVRQNTQQYTYKDYNGKDMTGFLIDQNLVNDPNFQVNKTGQYRGEANHSNGLSKAAGLLGAAAMFVPGLQPFAAFANVAGGLSSGNIGQSLAGALGVPGVGSAVNGFVGSNLANLGVAKDLIPYATKGLVSAGTTALAGGNLQQALTNGLASGTGAYGGSKVAGLLNGAVPASVSGGLSQATAGALGSAIRGGDVGKSALYSGLGGFASGLGKDLTAGMENGITKNLLNAAPSTALGLLNYQQSQNATRQRAQIPQTRAPQRVTQLRQRIAAMRA